MISCCDKKTTKNIYITYFEGLLILTLNKYIIFIKVLRLVYRDFLGCESIITLLIAFTGFKIEINRFVLYEL
ncbi:TPA: hypothetical protein KOQ70_000570 [Clostridioides difficile]|nr:hypothetical protein [Clostridioides difficile]